MVNVLIGCTGSVATIKLPTLVAAIRQRTNTVNVRVVVTSHAQHFYSPENVQADIYTDEIEWSTWSGRGDPVVHIELGKWADLLVIAPLDANTLAKIANGLCDNLLTCVVRAWDISKPLYFCPAMNTRMYNHPLTDQQIKTLESWGYQQIPSISKTLMCGDVGRGAMAEIETIVETLKRVLNLSSGNV